MLAWCEDGFGGSYSIEKWLLKSLQCGVMAATTGSLLARPDERGLEDIKLTDRSTDEQAQAIRDYRS